MDLAIGLIIMVAVSITSEKHFLYSSFCSPFHSLHWHLQDTYFAFLAVCLLRPVFGTTHHILGTFPNIPVGLSPWWEAACHWPCFGPGLTDRSTVGMECSHSDRHHVHKNTATWKRWITPINITINIPINVAHTLVR